MNDLSDTASIFRQHRDKVYRLALTITRNEKDAEDVLQNSFIKIIKNLQYFRNQSKLSTWIYRIAYNEALMYLRKKRNQARLAGSLKQAAQKLTADLFVNWHRLPDKSLLDAELKQRIDRALKAMPIKYRMPLLLANVERLPLKDSAAVMGLKLNSLKTRLHRANLLVKKDLTAYFQDKEQREVKEDKKCGAWTGFFYDYAHGLMDNRRSQLFKEHIRDCPGCNGFLDTYGQAIKVTGALACHDLPQELKKRIETFLSLGHLKQKSRKESDNG